MLCNYDDAQDAQKPTPFLHPHDPIVETEYENLIKAWKHQLIDKVPPAPSNDYVRFAWMRLMDHYLDQQWLDSKQMLQCAQAWSARDSISLSEAVHTMNILSLKSMQRSLDARQELLQALGDPDFMVSFGMSPTSTNETERMSLAGSEDEDSEIHAPLLMKHNTSPDDEAIMTTEEIIDDYHDEEEEEEETDSQQTIENDDSGDLQSLCRFERSRITSSSSTPNISTTSSEGDFANDHRGFTRKYESYYQQLHKASSWKEIELKQDDSSDERSSTDSSNMESNVQWKSWFLQNKQQTEEMKPIIFEADFADEKVETDVSLNDFYGNSQPYLMVRSESSISAFRPISNNLAPRCQQLNSDKRSSLEIQEEEQEEEQEFVSATITKSKSFPSKSALSDTIKKSFSPPPVPHKERNFMLRSFVNKKVSLSKFFNGRKPSTSSSSSSNVS